MFWAQLRILFPSFFGYWIAMVVLASAAWYMWTKIYTHYTFNGKAPVLMATAMTVYMMTNTMTSIYQNTALMTAQQSQPAAKQDQQASNQQPPVDPALQMKANFLRLVESMVQNPDQITPDTRKKLFVDYAKLFPKAEERMTYAKAISEVYSCQRSFWEDAMAAYKAKTIVKSDTRKDCEKLSGAFFNREKLVPVETAKSNDDTVASLAAHKRVPASDGKLVEVTETMLRNVLDAQVRQSEALKKIFE